MTPMTDLAASRLARFALIVCDPDNTLRAIYQYNDRRRLLRFAADWKKAGCAVAILSRRQAALRGLV